MRKVIIIPLLLLFSLTSCTSVFLSLYVMKKPRLLSTEEQKKEAKRQGISIEHFYQIDTNYWAYLEKMDNSRQAQVKNHSQPLQALYFDEDGRLFRFYVNCYASGFPNLQWNRFGGLDQFPPLPQSPVDSLFSFQDIAALIRPYGVGQQVIESATTIVVFWNRMMGRQSKRFVKLIQQNAQLSKSPIQLMFVNTDELFLEMLD